MTSHRTPWIVASFFGLLPAAPAQADAMHCGSDLVSDGDSTYEVRSVCGEPDAMRERIEYRSVQVFVTGPCQPGAAHTVCGRYETQLVPIVLEEWTYDFGPTNFIRYVTFENGKLRDIATGDYGKKKK
jgi:hypothetical protein